MKRIVGTVSIVVMGVLGPGEARAQCPGTTTLLTELGEVLTDVCYLGLAGVDVGAEAEEMSRINAHRGAIGAPGLAASACLGGAAREWAQAMAGAGSISHSDLAALVGRHCDPGWEILGENVGVGPNDAAIFDAFLNSPGHRANIEDRRFGSVGTGAVRTADGRLFVTQLFAKFTAPASAPAPAPARPAASSVAAPPQPTRCGAIDPGHGLSPGQSVSSCDGRSNLVLQHDGNLVLYHAGRPLWSTRTDRKGGTALVMQGDGNLVLYNASGRPLWSSKTSGRPGAWFAIQDDGNMVVYADRARWSSRTCCR